MNSDLFVLSDGSEFSQESQSFGNLLLLLPQKFPAALLPNRSLCFRNGSLSLIHVYEIWQCGRMCSLIHFPWTSSPQVQKPEFITFRQLVSQSWCQAPSEPTMWVTLSYLKMSITCRGHSNSICYLHLHFYIPSFYSYVVSCLQIPTYYLQVYV